MSFENQLSRVAAAVVSIFGLAENKAAGRYSATTTIAALLAFVLGAYAAIGDVRIAAASAVAAAALLIFRRFTPSNNLAKVVISVIIGHRWFAARIAGLAAVSVVLGWLVLIMTLARVQ